GDEEPLPGGLASHLLPFMLDPRGSNIMTKVAEGTPATSFRLKSSTDGSAWRVSVGPQGRQVDADPAQLADVEVEAEPGWLALALYGRAPVTGPHFQVSDGPAGAERFQAAFGP
ncbi:MAG: hypothetical protein ACHQ7M_09215, partial [Chloroflexota bacterium]